MDSLTKVLLIALGLSLISLIIIRIFNTFSLNRIAIHEINSADSNISSSKIDSIIQKFKVYLKIEELNISYGETESYYRINQMLNKRKKQITIPKWIMPSVGYELDYILASIWFNAKLFQKDRDIKKMQLILKWIPLFLYIVYFSTFILSFVIYFLNKEAIIQATSSKFLIFIFSKPLMELISLTVFLSIVILIFSSNILKIRLEEKYENEIIGFVKNECESYKMDISAARIYAKEFNKLDFKIFRINAKTSNLKFVGPFTLL
ncbi:hypothetical protein [Spiroplasma floricola]|uniref:Transmembrane protein n=1 Tax=Spiroplasma floricola 23-6 TaxID=1336749 RepID=A0A2K8SEV6_9MOLU|nr:hypothetical protein [Spiroplasma floricola]AUB31370.1 hypothetical protein SFLOR_v1c03130 [Spiroplasma floricola 23-6]